MTPFFASVFTKKAGKFKVLSLIYQLFSNKQDDKPGYVVNNHLSRAAVTGSLKRPT